MWLNKITRVTTIINRSNSRAIEEAQKFTGKRTIAYHRNKEPLLLSAKRAGETTEGFGTHPMTTSDAKTLVCDKTGGRLDLYNKMSKSPPQGASFEIKQADGILSCISKESHVVDSREPSFKLEKLKHSPTPIEDMQRATGINIKDIIIGFNAYCYTEYKYLLKGAELVDNEEACCIIMTFLKGQARQSLKTINDGSEVLSKITRKLYNGEKVSWSLMTQITKDDHDIVRTEADRLEYIKSTTKIPNDQLEFVKECHKEGNPLAVDANDKYALYKKVEAAHKLKISEARRFRMLRTLQNNERNNNIVYRTAQAASNFQKMDYDNVIASLE